MKSTTPIALAILVVGLAFVAAYAYFANLSHSDKQAAMAAKTTCQERDNQHAENYTTCLHRLGY